jgi:hypothetical protein
MKFCLNYFFEIYRNKFWWFLACPNNKYLKIPLFQQLTRLQLSPLIFSFQLDFDK